jgi:hypothetical protein
MVGDHPNDIQSGKLIGKDIDCEVVGVKIQEEAKVEEIVSMVREMDRIIKSNKAVEVSCCKTL